MQTAPSDADPFEPVARRVARELKEAIIMMRLAPGAKLSEQEVARQLGVSRQPVREAFIMLAASGLLKIYPQRGTRVVPISKRAVQDARFIREAIEVGVVKAASELRPKAKIEAIAENLKAQRAAMRAQDSATFFRLDEAFHSLLAEAAGRSSAWAVIQDVKAQMDRVRYIDMTDPLPMRIVYDQHVAIYEAVAAGDAEAAERCIRQHLAEILRSLPQIAAARPDIFVDDIEIG